MNAEAIPVFALALALEVKSRWSAGRDTVRRIPLLSKMHSDLDSLLLANSLVSFVVAATLHRLFAKLARLLSLRQVETVSLHRSQALANHIPIVTQAFLGIIESTAE